MHAIKRTALLHDDPRTIMRYIGAIEHHKEFMMPIVSLTDITGEINIVGSTWKWTFVMAGITISGTGKTTQYIPDRLLEYKTEGDTRVTMTYETEPHEENTLFTLSINYEIPHSVLEKVKEPIVTRLNNLVADQVVNHFKALFNE